MKVLGETVVARPETVWCRVVPIEQQASPGWESPPDFYHALWNDMVRAYRTIIVIDVPAAYTLLIGCGCFASLTRSIGTVPGKDSWYQCEVPAFAAASGLRTCADGQETMAQTRAVKCLSLSARCKRDCSTQPNACTMALSSWLRRLGPTVAKPAAVLQQQPAGWRRAQHLCQTARRETGRLGRLATTCRQKKRARCGPQLALAQLHRISLHVLSTTFVVEPAALTYSATSPYRALLAASEQKDGSVGFHSEESQSSSATRSLNM